ncbi:MAG: bifunctional 4-hydroxy-3-methylbut-2-enyl diphosphate reductase/30S ribosomal protein S1 [Clostridia bacterium]|nr:bifunctional 4-hydroxy-3-methylbut-2-enyl diphosphate reductase/30S ribosomal protein S1 [Clostridia bacterium]MBQ8859642.1 bifunctional 4-hydroxy-3-methylbut-2-enyl diphosphate reductase/30S ribosomal protein S1 [Clostridia bacterium]
MKITVAENAGFCFGVKRATDAVEALLSSGEGGRVCILGHLIHNRLYNESLEKKGVLHVTIEEAERLANEKAFVPLTLVIRTHGVSCEQEARLRALAKKHEHVRVLDMTCPFVKKIHRIADENTDNATVFFLLGTENHPEVQGILSYVRGEKYLFRTAKELQELLKTVMVAEKTAIFAAQTTQNLEEWKKSQKIIEKYCTNAKKFDTICSVTENRQQEALRLAARSDRVIVIGGRDSSNTAKLYELCRAICPHTQWVESSAELAAEPIAADEIISITAGASTPDDIIKEVFETMNHEVSFEEMLEDSLKTLHTGETVRGIVTAISQGEIYVDLGAKVTGVITHDQITDDSSAKLSELFRVGDEVEAFVMRVSDRDGMASLSKKRIDADKNWAGVVASKENGEILEGKVTKVIKGGVIILYNGAQVFVPASHTGVPKDGDIATLVGTTQRFKLIEIDPHRKNSAKGSIRVVLSAERRAKEEELWATLEVGQHFTGKVKNLTAYGAFVDLGGVDGMVHNTELSWKRIKSPADVVSVGQEIEVYIKDLDKEAKRISLGYKTEEMDPWYQFRKQFGEGDEVDAKIVSMMPFGAFAEVFDGVDGLIHISQISLDKIAKPEDALSVGQIVHVKITEVDDEKRKISLSIKALLLAEKKAAEAEAEAAAAAEQAAIDAEMAPYIVKSI